MAAKNGATPAAAITTKNKTFGSFKSKEHIHKKEDWANCTVSDN